MNYNDENRGEIQFRKRAKQIIDFKDIRYGKITPTDIDGFFEHADKMFVFYEFKLDDAEVPAGQKLALERIVDGLSSAGKEAVLFLCRHNIKDTEKDIKAADTLVDKIYYNGKWHKKDKGTAKEWTDKFVRYVEGRDMN